MKDSTKSNENRYAIHSINKALDVLEALSDTHSMNLIELSDLVDQPRSSLYRILLTLETRGYVERSPETGKYCMGYQQLTLTKNLLEKNSLRAVSTHEMRKLVDKYGDTVNVGVLSSGEVVYLQIVEGTHSLRMSETVGTKAPSHATGLGKALLAHISDKELNQALKKCKFEKYTDTTITSREQLMAEIGVIRAKGYSFDNEETTLGASCVAVPILGANKQVLGAISISGASHRYGEEQRDGIAQDLKLAAKNIANSVII
jgi:DNA-binding IclR family transcriptional regulator